MAVRTSARRLAAGTALAAAIAAPAFAQEPGSQPTREFVQAAAQTDQFEILAATTALAQSRDVHVRAFAQAMIDTHQRTTAALLDAVAKAGLEPPKPGIGGDQAMFLAALQSQRGADFDRLYARQQALAHRAALAVEQAYAADGDAPAIRQAAATAVPVIAEHLKMAERIRSEQGDS